MTVPRLQVVLQLQHPETMAMRTSHLLAKSFHIFGRHAEQI